MSAHKHLLLLYILPSLIFLAHCSMQLNSPKSTLFDHNPLLYTAILQARSSQRNLFGINNNSTTTTAAINDNWCIPDLSNLNSTIFQYLTYSGKSPNDYGFYTKCQNLTTHPDIMAISPPNYMRVNYKAQGELDIFWGICFPQKCRAQVKVLVDMIAPIVFSPSPDFQDKYIDTFEPVTVSDPLSVLMITIAVFFILLGIIGMIIQYTSVGNFRFKRQVDVAQSENLMSEQNDSNDVKQLSSDFTNSKEKQSTILGSDSQVDQFHFKGTKSPPALPPPSIDKIDILDRKQKWAQFLMSFSLTYNLTKLVTRQRPRSTLDVLDGVRVLSIFWVIIGHSYVFINTAGARNVAEVVTDFPRQFLFTLVMQGNLAVDTFFFLSAFLGAYVFLKKYPTNKRCLNPLQVLIAYFHRYYRLTPLLAFIMYFCAFVVYPLAYGPARMKLYGQDIEACKKYGWKQIVYVMNFIGKPQEQCFAWAWYLSNDMQMFLILPWIIILYKFLPLLGTIVLAALFLGNFIVTGVVSWNHNLGVTQFSHNTDFMLNYYIKPWIRVLPYLIGIGFAMMYQNYKGVDDYEKKVAKWRKQHGSNAPIQQIDDLKNTRPVRKGFGYYIFNSAKKSTLLTWIYFLLGFALTFIMVFILYQPYKDLGDAWTKMGRTFYNIFGRGVFIIGLAMVLIPLFVGRLTMLADFLSCELFAVMAKVTYSVYLLHQALITVFYYSYKVESYLTHLEAFMAFFTFMILSYLIGSFVSILIDFPLGNIDKVFIFPDKKKQKESFQKLKAYAKYKAIES